MEDQIDPRIDKILNRIQRTYGGYGDEKLKSHIVIFDNNIRSSQTRLYDLYNFIKYIADGNRSGLVVTMLQDDDALFRILYNICDFFPESDDDMLSIEINRQLNALSEITKLLLKDFNEQNIAKVLIDKTGRIETAIGTAENVVSKIEKLKTETEKKFTFDAISIASHNYRSIAAEEKFASLFWLSLTIALGVALLFNSFFEFNTFFFHLTKYDIPINEYSSSIVSIILSISLVIGIIGCGKRYGLCRQQAIKYRHLATVCSAYELMMKALEDKHHAFVTQEAVRVLFSIQAPSEKSTDASVSLTSVIDLVKTLMPGSNENDTKKG